MKSNLVVILVIALLYSPLSAKNYYKSFCLNVSHFGRSIEEVNDVPMIGKLTNLLPMAVLAAGLKECPMQTMIVLTALGVYFLSDNEVVRNFVNRCKVDRMSWLKRNHINERPIDENIFVFDGEEEDSEDGLLGGDLLEEEDSQDMKRIKRSESSRIFL